MSLANISNSHAAKIITKENQSKENRFEVTALFGSLNRYVSLFALPFEVCL